MTYKEEYDDEKIKQEENIKNTSFTTIMMFIVMVLLTGGLVVEHSRLAIVPLFIAVFYGVKLLMKYEKGEI